MTSRTPRTTRTLITAGLASAALLVAACGGGSDDAAGDTDAAGSTVVAERDPGPETTTEPDATTESETTEVVVAATESLATEADAVTETTEATPPATEPVVDDTLPARVDPEPEEVPADGDGSCLVGDWVIGEDQMNAYYDALESTLAANGPAPDFDITGNVLLSFGVVDYAYTGAFDLTIDVAGQTGTGQTTGTVTGTWDVVDGLVVTTLGSSDLDVVITIAGVTLSGSDFANGLLDSAPINGAPFDCAGPTIGFQLGEPDGPRHDVLLTPA